MLDLTLPAPCSKAMPEQAQLLLGGRSRQPGHRPGAILCQLDSPEQRVGLAEAASHSPTYRNQVVPIGRRWPIGCAKGNRAMAVLDHSSAWEPYTTIPGCAARPPRLPAETSRCALRAQREELGQPPRAFSQESPGSAVQQERPCLLQLEAFRGALAPAARPPGYRRNSIGCCSKDQGRASAALLAHGTPVLAPGNQPGEDIWPMAKSAWSWQQPQAEQCCSQGWAATINKTVRLVHTGPLLEGAEAAFA